MSASLLILSLLPRIALATLTYGAAIIDISRYKEVAKVVLAGGTAYELPARYYPYPPPWQYIEAAALLISRFSGLSFDFVVKIPSIIADAAIAILLYLILLRSNQTKRMSLIWSLLFAFNPASIMISSGHGQFDSLPIAFSLAALYLAMFFASPHNALYLSALLLGMGVALKVYPILFLPLFLAYLQDKKAVTLKQSAIYLLSALFPLFFSLLPFLLKGQIEPFMRPFMYVSIGGVTDLGLMPILKTLHFPIRGLSATTITFKDVWLIDDFARFFLSRGKVLFFTKLVFAGGYLVLVSRARRFDIPNSILIVCLLIYVVIGGLSAQYLIWIVPFAILTQDLMIVLYTVVSTAALVSFYLTHYPEALFGLNAVPEYLQIGSENTWFTAFNTLFWITCGIWLWITAKRTKVE